MTAHPWVNSLTRTKPKIGVEEAKNPQKLPYQARGLRYRIKGSGSRRKLAKMANPVNCVWNYLNDVQRQPVRWGRLWPNKDDFQNLTSGSSRELGLYAQTV